MSSNGPEPLRGSASNRPHHGLSRSVSEVASIPKATRSHLPHHPHNPLHRRDKDDKVPQSAGPTLQPGIDWSKSESVTPAASQNPSRRASISGDDSAAMSSAGRPRQPVKEGEVKEERERNVLRATELSKSLMELNTLSNTTTRRLDTTYYSVQERLSALQGTITSLKELAALTRGLSDEFKDASEEVVNDIELQLNHFENFQLQQTKIEGLEARIKRGQEKVKKLGDRVEDVRDKVESWETLEDDWQQKMRKRLKVIWGIIAVVLVVVVGLFIFPYTPSRTQNTGVLQGFNMTNLSKSVPELESKLINETMNFKRKAAEALESLRAQPEDPLEEDPRLRAFDEL